MILSTFSHGNGPSLQKNGLAGVDLSLGHLAPLTLHPLIFLLMVHQGLCVHAIIGYPIDGSWWEDKRCSGYIWCQLAKQHVD
jgi:hypothetical protein